PGHRGPPREGGTTWLPAEVRNKRNRLSEAGFAQAKQHVEYSVEILQETPGLPPGLPELAVLHHERQDGSGYPKGLKGRDIGLLGRSEERRVGKEGRGGVAEGQY